MKLSFTVDVVLEVPDDVVVGVLAERVKEGDPDLDTTNLRIEDYVDCLSVGDFGELTLEKAARGTTLLSYSTQQYVELVD